MAIRRTIQNVAIFLLVLVGIRNMLASLPIHLAFWNQLNTYYNHINPSAAAVHRVLSFLTGFLVVVLALRLYKRVRLALLLELIVLSISIVSHFILHRGNLSPITFIELLILVILAASYRDFRRRSDHISVKWALILAALSIVLVVTNTTIGMFMLKEHYHSLHDLGDAFLRSVQFLFMMDSQATGFVTKTGRIYADSMIVLNWICIIGSTLLILKPLVLNSITSSHERERARGLALKYGQNPISYLAVENDKRYFFGANVEGVAAYTIVGDVFVCCGDIICADENAKLFLQELATFCKDNNWDILLLNITEHYLPLYQESGMGCVKYGEDACFFLAEYNLKGGAVAKVRAAINHANKAGITVSEYKPLQHRDTAVEDEINAVSQQWLSDKRGDELSFMLGGTGLENPMERRYFLSRDADGKLLGFVVFLPYAAQKGYLADVTRRLPNAPQGVLEKTVYDAFMIMRDEGVQWGCMGLSPLYNMPDGDKKKFTEKLFSFVYDHLNDIYGFKALHHAKEKYAPTHWQPRYLAYYPNSFSPRLAYAMVKAQNPGGISKLLLVELKAIIAKKQAGQQGESI